MLLAKSMRQALLAGPNKVTALNLSASPDLVCKNFMCEKMGRSCVCKFARFMEQNEWTALEDLDVSNNKLSTLPMSMFLPSLRWLNFSRNDIEALDMEYFAKCPALEVINASGNAKLSRLEWDDKLRETIPGLKQVVWE